MNTQTTTPAWGLDYRKTRRADAAGGERWITTLTRLTDGRLLVTWENRHHRPELAEVRQVLSRGLAQYAHPEVLWCDAYLATWAAPIAELYNIRLHIRCADRALRAPIPERVTTQSPPPKPDPSWLMPVEVKHDQPAAFWRAYFRKFFHREGREGARKG